jgi:hypothetical protein
VDVADRALDGGGTVRDEADETRRRHHHAHSGGEPLDALVVGEPGDGRAKLLVAALQRGAALQRAADARPELEHLDLHRDDAREHHTEHRDPRAAANDPVEQWVIRQCADEADRAPGQRLRGGRATAPAAWADDPEGGAPTPAGAPRGARGDDL